MKEGDSNGKKRRMVMKRMQ